MRRLLFALGIVLLGVVAHAKRPGAKPLDLRLKSFYCETTGQAPEPGMEDWAVSEAAAMAQLPDQAAQTALDAVHKRRSDIKHSHLARSGRNLRRGPATGHSEVSLPDDLSTLIHLTAPDARGGVQIALPDKPTEPLRCPDCHAKVRYLAPQE